MDEYEEQSEVAEKYNIRVCPCTFVFTDETQGRAQQFS